MQLIGSTTGCSRSNSGTNPALETKRVLKIIITTNFLPKYSSLGKNSTKDVQNSVSKPNPDLDRDPNGEKLGPGSVSA